MNNLECTYVAFHNGIRYHLPNSEPDVFRSRAPRDLPSFIIPTSSVDKNCRGKNYPLLEKRGRIGAGPRIRAHRGGPRQGHRLCCPLFLVNWNIRLVAALWLPRVRGTGNHQLGPTMDRPYPSLACPYLFLCSSRFLRLGICPHSCPNGKMVESFLFFFL